LLPKKFLEHLLKTKLMLFDKRLLVALSGGVDSIVLLDLLLDLRKMFNWEIAVVHINHKLRHESDLEARNLRDLIQNKELIYFEKIWIQGAKCKTGKESKARKFRYGYFASLMKDNNFDYLVTAHHGDDQIETQMMKWIRGNFLGNLKGIVPKQPFANGFLIRPLLNFSKEELRNFAVLRNLIYFEDASNNDEHYFRNRVRKKILPFVKEENSQAIAAANRLSKQISFFEEICLEDFANWQVDSKVLDLQKFVSLSESRQYLYLLAFLKNCGVTLSAQFFEQLYALLLAKDKPSWRYQLSSRSFLVREYNFAFFEGQANSLPPSISDDLQLKFGERVAISNNETVIFGGDNFLNNYPVKEVYFTSETKILIRHPKVGDRIALTKNLSKKIARLFIDEKIPRALRLKKWLVEDAQGVLFIPNFKYSYFSKEPKIHQICYLNTISEQP